MSGSFTFNTAVGDAEVTGSSAVYAVVVRTNLPEYAEHGEGPRVAETQLQQQQAARGEPDDDVVLETLVTIPERTITVKRSYSEFKEVCVAPCSPLLSSPYISCSFATLCASLPGPATCCQSFPGDPYSSQRRI